MEVIGSLIKRAIQIRSKIPVEKRNLNPILTQQQTLKKLLKKASITSFGEFYGFESILNSKDLIAGFKEKIPIFDYNTLYKKWWFRSIQGEAFVTWPGKVKYFALSSGTSEASSKQIPVTQEMIKAIRKTSIRQILALTNYDFPPEFYNKGILMLGGSTHLQFNGTYFEGDLSGIGTKNIPFWFQHFYKPGKRISKERDWNTKLDEIVKKAKDWDIGVICGVPAWLQILMQRIIDHYKLDTIHDIWPNLTVYAWGGVSLTPYKKGFEKLLAKPLIYMETYLASEGFIAYQDRPDSDAMHLVLDNGIFYEFIPFTEQNFDELGNLLPNAKTLTIDEVKENTDYALLLSTCAGAWRYLIGDTIKFTSLANCEIQITGRTKHFINICGEHLSQENMNQALKMLEDEYNIDVPEFCLSGIKYDSMFAHQWYLGTNDNIDADKASEALDRYLKTLNDDYRVERIAAIRSVKVKVLNPEIFYDFLRKKGKEGGQHKFPRVLRGDLLNEWIDFINISEK